MWAGFLTEDGGLSDINLVHNWIISSVARGVLWVAKEFDTLCSLP